MRLSISNHILLVICAFCVEQLLSQSKQASGKRLSILAKRRLSKNLSQLQTSRNGEPNGVHQYLSSNPLEVLNAGQNRLLQQLPSRSDNRNMIMDTPIFGRPAPRCNKKIRIANGVTRFRDKGSLVRYACSHGFTLLGATIAVCLRDQWNEPPPICTRPGCRSLLAPLNGVARLSYSGAVADFICNGDEYLLEGSQVIYCDGNRWNDTEPVCTSIQPLTTTTPTYWEWPQPSTESEGQLSPDEQPEAWDYNYSPSFTTENPKFTEGTGNNSQFLNHPSTPTSGSVPLPTEKATSSPSLLNNNTPTVNLSSFDYTTSKLHLPETTLSNIVTTRVTPSTLIISNSTPVTTTGIKTTESPLIAVETTSMKKSSSTTITIPNPDPTVVQTKSTVVPENTPQQLDSSLSTTTENWEPFPDNAFDKFDEDINSGSYETTGTVPEFIQPISPHKLEDDINHEYYKKLATISIVGGIILGALGTISIVGGMATYCWRKNIGIARPHSGDIDGRTLSASDANDDFMWLESNRDHRMSRL